MGLDTPIGGSPAPEIKVWHGAIINEGNQPVFDAQTEPIDFGVAYANATGTALVKDFWIRNEGNAVLNMSGLTFPAPFAVDKPLPAKLGVGVSDRFCLRLPLDNAGEFSGIVQFATNDADENPFSFPIKGKVQ